MQAVVRLLPAHNANLTNRYISTVINQRNPIERIAEAFVAGLHQGSAIQRNAHPAGFVSAKQDEEAISVLKLDCLVEVGEAACTASPKTLQLEGQSSTRIICQVIAGVVPIALKEIYFEAAVGLARKQIRLNGETIVNRYPGV